MSPRSFPDRGVLSRGSGASTPLLHRLRNFENPITSGSAAQRDFSHKRLQPALGATQVWAVVKDGTRALERRCHAVERREPREEGGWMRGIRQKRDGLLLPLPPSFLRRLNEPQLPVL